MVTSIVLLILLGMILILLEVFIVPGATLVGLLGIAMCGVGVYLVYDNYGSSAGHLTLLGVLLGGAIATVIGFRSGAWSRFSLKKTVEGRMNVIEESSVQLGQVGVAISVLRPAGTAKFDDYSAEVHTLGEFVEEGTHVRVISLEDNKIIVEEIKI